MTDERIKHLAYNLINKSVNLQKGEKILIHISGNDSVELARELIKEAYKLEAIPFFLEEDKVLTREILKSCTQEQLEISFENQLQMMKSMDAYLGVRASENISELSDIPHENMEMYNKAYETVLNERVNNTKWCILRYPNPSMAQMSGMSTEAFEDLYFKVCNLDYSKMDKAMDNLHSLMCRTDRVHIKGPGTDLTFSIKDIGAKKCAGECNIPDGEVYSAPVKDSVNGTISYNAPSTQDGTTFTDIKLEFKDGKIVNAASNNTEKINKIFDMDEGSRYVGEFAIGVNPYIKDPMNDILFDEKIQGSFHFTPGRCYEDVSNGNASSLHWDLVCIQTPEYGGGEIYFDDVLIRKDGRFIIDELLALNPENLV